MNVRCINCDILILGGPVGAGQDYHILPCRHFVASVCDLEDGLLLVNKAYLEPLLYGGNLEEVCQRLSNADLELEHLASGIDLGLAWHPDLDRVEVGPMGYVEWLYTIGAEIDLE